MEKIALIRALEFYITGYIMVNFPEKVKKNPIKMGKIETYLRELEIKPVVRIPANIDTLIDRYLQELEDFIDGVVNQ